jgi:hypothetical protein
MSCSLGTPPPLDGGWGTKAAAFSLHHVGIKKPAAREAAGMKGMNRIVPDD